MHKQYYKCFLFMYPFNKALITLRQKKKSKYHDQAKEYHYFQLLVHVKPFKYLRNTYFAHYKSKYTL